MSNLLNVVVSYAKDRVNSYIFDLYRKLGDLVSALSVFLNIVAIIGLTGLLGFIGLDWFWKYQEQHPEFVETHQTLIGGFAALAAAIMSVVALAIGALIRRHWDGIDAVNKWHKEQKKFAQRERLSASILAEYLKELEDEILTPGTKGLLLASVPEVKTERQIPIEFYNSRYIDDLPGEIASLYVVALRRTKVYLAMENDILVKTSEKSSNYSRAKRSVSIAIRALENVGATGTDPIRSIIYPTSPYVESIVRRAIATEDKANKKKKTV